MLMNRRIQFSIAEQDAAKSITKTGMAANMALALGKGAVGLGCGSTALVADAWHSLSDMVSDIVTLWAVDLARVPPDHNHPYGHGKFEALASLSIGVLLVGGGGVVAIQSLDAIVPLLTSTLSETSGVSSTDFLKNSAYMTGAAAGMAVLSLVSKEMLYRKTLQIGQRLRSNVLIANAWHHRTDAMSSVVALGGIFGTAFGFPLLDPAAGMVVAGMICKAGVSVGLESIKELTDEGVDSETAALIEKTVLAVPDVIACGDLRTRRMGSCMLVDMKVQVDGRISVSVAELVAAQVSHAVKVEVDEVSDVMVHIQTYPLLPRRDANSCSAMGASRVSSLSLRDSAKWPTGLGVDSVITKEEVTSLGLDAGAVSNTLSPLLLPSQSVIHSDVETALSKVPGVEKLSHLIVHCNTCGDLRSKSSSYSVEIDVKIIVDHKLQVREAHNIAKKARRAVEEIPYVNVADIHLELFDDYTNES